MNYFTIPKMSLHNIRWMILASKSLKGNQQKRKKGVIFPPN